MPGECDPRPGVFSSGAVIAEYETALVRHTSPVLRSIVLITESIFPLNTCLARLKVKPETA